MAAKPAPARSSANPAGKKGLLIPIGIAIVVAMLVGSVGAWYFARSAAPATTAEAAKDGEPGKDEENGALTAAEKKKPPVYFPLDPAFVVNLTDETGDRYLQVELQVTSRSSKAKEILEMHNGLVRHQLLLLFSQEQISTLRTRGDKERLQKSALKEIQTVLKEASGEKTVDGLYFTSFVTQ